MRLLFFTRTLTVGGVQINALYLGKALVERGHDVWFLADRGPLVSRVVGSGMGFIDVPYMSRSHPSLNIMRALSAAIKTHDIDLVQAFDSPPILEAYAVGLWLGVPVYGIAAMQRLPRFRLPKRRELAVVNGDTRDRYVNELGWDASKLRLIVAPLDSDYYKPIPSGATRVLSEFGIRPDERVALLVTRVETHHWPTIELFLSAAEHWARSRRLDYTVRFVVVGGGTRLKELERRVSRLTGGIGLATGERMDIPAVMNDSDIILGMASTCQQGMACGKPVIAVGTRGLTVAVTPGSFEYATHHHFNLHGEAVGAQPETLCRQIEETLSDVENARQLGRFGRRIAVERYDSRIVAAELEEVYTALLANSDTSPAGRLLDLGDLLLSLGHVWKGRMKGLVFRLGRPIMLDRYWRRRSLS